MDCWAPPSSNVYDSVDLGRDKKICISNKFLENVDVADEGDHTLKTTALISIK
jgi:hypothetical protein